MSEQGVRFISMVYRHCAMPILFKFDSEYIHNKLTGLGGYIGRRDFLKASIERLITVHNHRLSQTIGGINFSNPVGLAAGFDYQAQLPEVLPSLGFGFGTVGTFSLSAYHGNPPPRLARLVKSRSLLVNKGFKNAGIDWLVEHSTARKFSIPVGLSLGRTNRPMDEKSAITDICESFKIAERARLHYSHYELNISCPNLIGTVSFYEPETLNVLLKTINIRKLSKPLFVKMPIDQTDERTLDLVRVIVDNGAQGIIIGNLQKNRSHPALIRSEVEKCGKGNFSGKPTWDRSNELISLVYQRFGRKITIVGCGGVFSAEEAYTKIRLGASLIQLVTGLIFEGPQLPAQINYGLVRKLENDGIINIRDSVGVDSKKIAA